MNVLASIVGSIPLIVGGWQISQSWLVGVLAGVIWFGFVAAVIVLMRRRFFSFSPPMLRNDAQKRIRSAREEIWSLQISGSEFTAHSAETYEEWLRHDKNRHLRIAFANPDNVGLLKSIVKLGGLGKVSHDDEAYRHLREVAMASLNRYIALRERLGNDQVDVRVYDCSPPFSSHAIDPDREASGASSLFVELYLPDLPSRERPCLIIGRNHSAFSLYRNQSLVWLRDASPVGPEPYKLTRLPVVSED